MNSKAAHQGPLGGTNTPLSKCSSRTPQSQDPCPGSARGQRSLVFGRSHPPEPEPGVPGAWGRPGTAGALRFAPCTCLWHWGRPGDKGPEHLNQRRAVGVTRGGRPGPAPCRSWAAPSVLTWRWGAQAEGGKRSPPKHCGWSPDRRQASAARAGQALPLTRLPGPGSIKHVADRCRCTPLSGGFAPGARSCLLPAAAWHCRQELTSQQVPRKACRT